jgi:hypothetical protein
MRAYTVFNNFATQAARYGVTGNSLKTHITVTGKNSGLSRVDKTLFSPIPGSVGQPDTDDAVSAVLDIGFIFKFENKF